MNLLRESHDDYCLVRKPPVKSVEGDEVTTLMGRVLKLPGRDEQIMLWRDNGATLQEIGTLTNISRERVRQLEHRFRERTL